ncbi:MAG: aspartate aminotransferase family protein [Acidimicrobiia bacterium]
MTRDRGRSDELAERARARIPGGVNSNVRLDGPQIFFDRGEGAWLWDVDGNEYVDYLLGQGPAFLGHASPPVVAAVEEASRKGMVYGGQNTYEVQAAELLCETLGWPEMVRFGSSGTEMVQAAIRLARAATGRTRFVRFGGHYHGWLDNVLVSYDGEDYSVASAGQPPDALAHTMVLPWNDLDAVATALEGGEVAAVIMEPVMLNSGAIAPREGYLAGVRELCDRHGTILIFDEIITGFRLAPGGVAELYGVIPDLATYGKAMAGSWPVGALAGPAHLMERIGTGEVTHAGTFNANVMGMAAVAATLRLLEESPPYPEMEKTGTRLMEGLGDIASRLGLPLRLQGWPMAFHASFGEGVEVWDHRDLARLDSARYRELAARLIDNGVWVASRGIWYLSAAHGDQEVEVTLDRAETTLSSL